MADTVNERIEAVAKQVDELAPNSVELFRMVIYLAGYDPEAVAAAVRHIERERARSLARAAGKPEARTEIDEATAERHHQQETRLRREMTGA